MMYLLAIVFPFVALFMCGKVFQGIICLILQCTFFGWLPAAIWAVMVVNQCKADGRHRELLAAVRAGL